VSTVAAPFRLLEKVWGPLLEDEGGLMLSGAGGSLRWWLAMEIVIGLHLSEKSFVVGRGRDVGGLGGVFVCGWWSACADDRRRTAYWRRLARQHWLSWCSGWSLSAP
jgi:hypothetical protein